MGGFIRKYEILTHPIMIIRIFGLQVFLACLLAKHNTPFLSILVRLGKI